MKYLLDTCVISELIKPKQNEKVISWIRSCNDNALYLSVLTIGEIQKGIAKLSDSQRKEKLLLWLDDELRKRFRKRILGITEKVACKWVEIQAKAELQGSRMPVIDSLIAATAIVHHLIFVTRNIADIETCGVKIFNPWTL
ncbi:MAG: type II toxin-antitoxin system VapC family toxin [Desulfobacterales bacterium]